MKVAIVGATGVLGRALVPRLLDAGHEVLSLSPRPEKAEKLYGSRVKKARVDLLEAESEAQLTELLQGYDAVLHIATAIPSDFNAPGAWDANHRIRQEGTRRLLNATLAAGVPRYVQQSVTLFYPDRGDEWITEDTPFATEAGSPNVPALIEMEGMVRAIPTDQLRWSILRGGGFLGPDTFQDYTIQLLKAGQPVLAGDGRAFQSYIHVEDMAEAVKLAAEQAPAGVILNINDEPMREGEFLEGLAAAVGAPKPVHNPDLPQPASIRSSNQRAKDVLGWQPTHSLIPEFENRTR